MTKSEAMAIFESTTRALRAIEGTGIPWFLMSNEVQEKVQASLKGAADEITRIHAMAKAELGKR